MTPEIVAAARRIIELWESKDSTVDQFKNAREELSRLTGKPLLGFYEVKNFAEGIVQHGGNK